MFQTGIDEYKKLVDNNLPTYLASLPSPFEPIDKYLNSEEFKDFSTEMIDVACLTALIRSHKDSKDGYDVNVYLVELLTSMFRIANAKLGWLDDQEASDLTSMLATDSNSEAGKTAIDHLVFCIRRFPYSIENQKYYTYLMPLLAYTKQYKFKMMNYFSRYMVNIINKYNITLNRGEHERDIKVDQLRCIPTLAGLLDLCAKDFVNFDADTRYWCYRNAIVEYARVFLGCLFQRSAIVSDFGKIGSEIVAYHYVKYQEVCQSYFVQKQAKEKHA